MGTSQLSKARLARLAGAITAILVASHYADAGQVGQPTGPQLTAIKAQVVASAKHYNIEPMLALSIIHTESKFNVGAINRTTHDYGIGQINIKTIHGYKFDQKKLLTNTAYSIDASMKVLYDIKKQYAKREPFTWHCRYNVGGGALVGSKSRNCSIYAQRIFKSLNSVQGGMLVYQIWGN